MAAMSYVAKKGHIKEYELAEREAGLAVFECKVVEDLWMAADEPLAGTVLWLFRRPKVKLTIKTSLV